MSTTAKKNTKKTALAGVVKSEKKQLTTAQKDKLIKELSDNANRNMSFKLMVRLVANRNK